MRSRSCGVGILLLFLGIGWAEDATFEKAKLPATKTSGSVPVAIVLSDSAFTVREKKSGAVRFEAGYGWIRKMSYGYLQDRRIALVPVYGLSALLLKGQSHWLVVESDAGGDAGRIVLRLHKNEVPGVIAALNQRSGKRVEALDPGSTALDATAGSHDEDVVLPFPVERVREALKAAMAEHSCKVNKDTPDRIECRRGLKPRIGGGGGETVVARLEPRGQETRLGIETRKGLGRNWSSPICQEARRRLAPPSM